jgi:hypothetical protein
MKPVDAPQDACVVYADLFAKREKTKEGLDHAVKGISALDYRKEVDF